MKFQNLSRALLVVSAGLGMTLGLTSCSNDHTVGYIYVLGTSVSGQSSGSIGAYKEDNNNGNLTPVSGGVISSGGQNPVRAVVASGNRFLYVLNAGTATTDTSGDNLNGSINGYSSAGIGLFSIGGFGQLTPQISYASQGYGQQRLAVNAAGTFLFVLDEYAPVGISAGNTTSPISAVGTNGQAPVGYPCADPVLPNVYHPVGDISVYSIDGPTGRLQPLVNQRQSTLTYFPVGCYPTDFRVTSSYVYVMDAGAPASTDSMGNVHTNDVQSVYVQALNQSNGQLTPTQTTTIPIRNANGTAPPITAINGDNSSKYIYLLDTADDLVFAYTIGAGGAPVTIDGSPFPSEPQATPGVNPGLGPVQSIVDSTGKYVFFANTSNTTGNAPPNQASSDVVGYNINATTGDLLVAVQNGSFNLGTVAGPVCIFEDPTNQYLYVAGSADNSITGRKIDPNTGTLRDLNKAVAFPVVGTPSWCLSISSAL